MGQIAPTVLCWDKLVTDKLNETFEKYQGK